MQTAEGVLVTDADGKQYYDCLAGAGTLALGHNHPVVIEAIQKMLDEKRPLHTLDITSEIKEEFVSEVFASLPEAFAKRAKIQFCGPTGRRCDRSRSQACQNGNGEKNHLVVSRCLSWCNSWNDGAERKFISKGKCPGTYA
jgi:hypothetical protein